MTITTPPERIETNGEPVIESVLEWLASPIAYPEPTRSVQRIDTHISWVFLTNRYVYKLKKPVRYDFLDFSTLERRRRACEEEVRLNRRLADGVYLGVIPVTMNKRGRFRLGGPGEPVDWVVKMHRLPAERALDRLIRSGSVTDADVNELAVRLAESYETLPPLSLNAQQYRQHIQDHVFANQHDLSDFIVANENGRDALRLKRTHAAQVRLLRLAPEFFDGRVCDGRIVEGHGDLRPEHIYLNPYPTMIDCIEFNEELRQLDVLDELAFLAVECEHLDAAWIGDRIFAEYRATSSDHFPQVLLDFYKSYRSCVRAKVTKLRASQMSEEARQASLAEAGRYLQLADHYAAKLGPPVLLVVYGLSGTGKTTLAGRLAEQLQIDGLGTDAIRRELFGKGGSSADHNAAIYQPAMRMHVYEELLRRAEHLLGRRLSVVLDGTFPTVRLRRLAAELARRHAAVPLLLHCHCQAESAIERIVSRAAGGQTSSDATPEVYQRQRADDEPDPPDLPVCHLDTDGGSAEITDTVFGYLRPRVGL